MRARLMQHEWRTLVADRTLALVTLVFGACLVYGMWNGVAFAARHQATLAEVTAGDEARLAELESRRAAIDAGTERVSPFADPRNPEAFARRLGPRHATLPVQPLAALSIGQADLLPSYYRVTSEARELVLAMQDIENPHRLLAGRFDVAFVLIYLYPLLILALTYNLLSEEKEKGTLALLLAQPVRLRDVVVSKVTVRALVFLAIVTAVVIGGLTAAGAWRGGATPGLMLLWAAVVVAYGAFWFSLAVLVASFGRGSAVNAMVLAGCWLVLVILLPSAFNLVATTLYPVPSRVEMIQAMREASDEATAKGSALLAEFYEDHPELAAGRPDEAAQDVAVIRLAVADRVERDIRPVITHYEAQLSRQRALVDRVRPLSPAIVVQEAMNDLAGSGARRHEWFLAQVDRFHAVWRTHFASLIVRRAQVGSPLETPAFVYEEETLSDVVARTGAAILWLVVPAGLIGFVALRRLTRYPIVS